MIQEERTEFKNNIIELMNKHNIYGASITIVKNMKIVFSKAFGKKEVGSDDKVTNNTHFLAGSVSKPIFALGVMILYQNNKLNIDVDVDQYLSSWQIPESYGMQNKITLRQLLTHTSGATVHGFQGYNIKDKIPTIVQILNGEPPANSPKVEIDLIPGTSWRYSGGGITIAQLTVCDLLKKDFPEIMNKLLFQKLNLNCTFRQPINKLNDYASGHINGKLVDGGYCIFPEMAAAGLWTSSRDLATIGIEICKGLSGVSEIFTQATIKVMLTPQYNFNKTNAQCIGFKINSKNKIFYHTGSSRGFVTTFSFTKQGDGIVIMINDKIENDRWAFNEELIKIIHKKYNWNLIKTVKEIPNIEKYVGKYIGISNNILCVISFKNKKLQLQINSYVIELQYDVNKNLFYADQFNIIIVFDPEKLYLYQKGSRSDFQLQ